VTLSTGFGDGASWSVRWLPATYPLPFGSSVSASFAGSLSRWLEYVFAYATHRFLLDRVSGLRFPDTAVYPRFSPLRTSRQTGGYAFTSAPEGQGLHLHGDEVTRLKVNLNLAVFPEAKASFRPTGRTPHLVVNPEFVTMPLNFQGTAAMVGRNRNNHLTWGEHMGQAAT